jgi:enoyl-CoA hydratase/carnithine racemase
VIKVDQDGRVRRLRLAAPDRHNIIDAPMGLALLVELKEAEADAGTGSILIEAEGPMFCRGASVDVDRGIFKLGVGSTKPIVVAVQGVALGTGLALIAGAHVAIAAQGSSFGFVDIREGLWNEDLFQVLARSIGARRALELGLTGRIFTAPDALNWGLLHVVAPAFELDDRAIAVARALAGADAGAVHAALKSRAKWNPAGVW